MAEAVFLPNRMTELPFGFLGRVFRSPVPFGVEFETGTLFDQFLEQNIQVVVNLLPREESLRKSQRDLDLVYQEAGIHMISLPVKDFHVPEEEQLTRALDQAIDLAQVGKNLVVHCNAGFGRTGTFLACLAVRTLRMQGDEAISWIRKFIPHAIENEDQKDFVIWFGKKYADP